MAWTPTRRGLSALAATGFAALGIAACGGGGGSPSTAASLPQGCEQVAKPPPKRVNLPPPPPKQGLATGKLTATVETSCGSFKIALDSMGQPKTVDSFVYLARKGFYRDTV